MLIEHSRSFYEENDFANHNEKEFYDKQYPHRKRSYYEILGVPRNANLATIQKAYRDLALKYHPKNNTDSTAVEKFTEVNEAYTHLSDAARRRNYDEFMFGEIFPLSSHNIFNDFFRYRPFALEADEKLFRPLMKSAAQIQKDIDRDWMNIEALGNSPNTEYAETVKTSTVQNRTPQGITGKTITEKSVLKDGKKKCIKTEEVLKPDGTKEVT